MGKSTFASKQLLRAILRMPNTGKYGKIFCCAVGVDSPLGIFWRGCNKDLSYFHVIGSAGLTKREAGLDRLHTLNINLMTLLTLSPFKYKLCKVSILVWSAHHSSLGFAQFTANAESTLVKLCVIWGNLLNPGLSQPCASQLLQQK